MAFIFSRKKSMEENSEKREGTIFDRMIRGAIFSFLAILSFGITLFFTGVTVQGVIFDRYMFFLLLSLFAFVAWMVGGVHAGKLRVKRTPLDIPILCFLAAYAISMMFSNDVWHSFAGAFLDPSRGFIVVVTSILLYYVVVSTQTLQSLYRLAGFFVAGLGIFSLWSAVAVSGFFQGGSGIQVFLASVPMGDFLSLNLLLTITFPLLLAYILQIVSKKTSSKMGKILGIFGLVFVAIYLYVFASLYLFSSIVALFIGLGIFISYVSGDIIRVSKQWIWLPLVIFLGALPIIYFLGQGIVAKKGMELNQNVIPSVQISWETLMNTMGERFFSGTGPATYAYTFSHFFPASLNATDAFSLRLSNAPNYFFEMVATSGIIGGLTFLILLIFAFSVGAFLLTQRRETNSVLSLGFWISLLVLIIVGFFYGISGAVVLPAVIIAIFAMAILLSESGREEKHITFSLHAAPQYALASTLLLLISCIGALALFATLGKMYAADIYAGRAFQGQGGDKKTAIGDIEKAINLNAKEGQYFVFRGRMYLALANEELNTLDPKAENVDKIKQQAQLLVGEAIRSLVRGRDLLPGNIFAQEVLAQAMESLGSMEDAYTLYKDAMKIEPKNPMYPVKMAEIRIAQAETKEGKEKEDTYNEAERLIQDAIAIKANYGETWYQDALLWQGRKNMDMAVESGKKALEMGRDIRSGLLLAQLYQVRNKEGDSKNAEDIFTMILGVNDKEVNAQLGLAGLYQKTGRTQDAIDRYTKVRDLLPAESVQAKDQLNAIIEKIKNPVADNQVK